ncbi:MAG: DUF922 domain-containing protein [Halarcobacter sp.]
MNRYIVVIFLLVNISYAEPIINVVKSYYSVSGNTENAIRRDINNKRYSYIGNNYDAFTKWSVDWHFNWKKVVNSCKINSVNTKVKVKYTFPRLINRNDLDTKVLKKWDLYKKALLKHENGHKNFAIKSAKEIENTLIKMHYNNCMILEKNANKIAEKIVNKYKNLEEEYDEKTVHGIKYGAKFP